MRSIQFNHVFAGLMGVALLGAFVLPRPLSDRLRAPLQVVFVPISSPVRAMASRIVGRIRPPEPVDLEAPAGQTRTYQQVVEENRLLRMALASVSTQFRQLRHVDAERASLSGLLQHCRAMNIVGGDSGLRGSVSIRGDISNLRQGMAAIYSGGLVGRLDRISFAGGAQVQLVTDRAFRVAARFGRMRRSSAGQMEFAFAGNLSGLVVGNGRDGMTVTNIPLKDVSESGLAAGDWAVIADKDYPLLLQGYRIGEIVAIGPSRTTPLFAEIQIRPVRDLQTLSEVMILVQ